MSEEEFTEQPEAVEQEEGPILTTEQARRQGQKAVEWLDEEMSAIPVFAKVQEWTGLSSSFQALIIVNILVWKAVTGELAPEIALIVGTVYPFFKSIQALQTDTDIEDDRTWLTYWMCYGCFTVLDMHIGWVLNIIPFYYTLKLMLFIWLQMPLGPFMGAKMVYRWFLKPVFRCIGPAIQRFSERHADEVYQLNWDLQKNLDSLKKTAMETGTEAFVEMAMDRMAEENATKDKEE